MPVELVSIELTNYCSKGCPFCYAKSNSDGKTYWTIDLLVVFIRDLARNGIKAVSFGGGEPLQFPGIWKLLVQLRSIGVFKSITTNGLPLLEPGAIALLPGFVDKVHVSLHYPEHQHEVLRVIRQVKELEEAGVKSGINFVLKQQNATQEAAAVRAIRDAGITAERVIFLPLRGKGVQINHERFRQVAYEIGSNFQSTWCLQGCRKLPKSVSIDWEGKVGWCSYTEARSPMMEFTYNGMMEALHARGLVYCG